MIWNFAFIASFQSFRSFLILSTLDLDIRDTQPCINCGFWTGSKAHSRGSWPHKLVKQCQSVRSFLLFMGTQCPPLPLSHSAKHLCKVIPPARPRPGPLKPRLITELRATAELSKLILLSCRLRRLLSPCKGDGNGASFSVLSRSNTEHRS